MSVVQHIKVLHIFQNFNTSFGLFWAILGYFGPFLSKNQQNVWFEPFLWKNKNFWRETNTYITKYRQFGLLYQRMGKIVWGPQATLKFKDFVSFSPRRSPESWKKLFSSFFHVTIYNILYMNNTNINFYGVYQLNLWLWTSFREKLFLYCEI